ncbi:hypothetical protein EDB85DRAFT_1904884 [Lactarius pseudohatsudake]|nr:hypothetical protein EDB85DRAFT_1904884 [Lactarius pseudohatsudake]
MITDLTEVAESPVVDDGLVSDVETGVVGVEDEAGVDKVDELAELVVELVEVKVEVVLDVDELYEELEIDEDDDELEAIRLETEESCGDSVGGEEGLERGDGEHDGTKEAGNGSGEVKRRDQQPSQTGARVPLTSPQLYRFSHTDDLRQAILYIAQLYPHPPLLGLGFSLGANILTRYIAEEALGYTQDGKGLLPAVVDTTEAATPRGTLATPLPLRALRPHQNNTPAAVPDDGDGHNGELEAVTSKREHQRDIVTPTRVGWCRDGDAVTAATMTGTTVQRQRRRLRRPYGNHNDDGDDCAAAMTMTRGDSDDDDDDDSTVQRGNSDNDDGGDDDKGVEQADG